MPNPKQIQLAAIVDDDQIHTFAIESLMNKCLFAEEIVAFSHGQEAWQYLSDHRHLPQQLPDVVFLDIEMPVMNAWKFLDEFKIIKDKLSKQIAIYILTTSIYKQDKQKAMSNPEVKGYIVKPMKPEDLDRIAEKVQDIN